MCRRVWLGIKAVCAGVGIAASLSCSGNGQTVNAPSPPGAGAISDDAALFRFVSETDPFTLYTRFPNAEEVTRGTLNGSSAHQPLVRVSLNAQALSALQNGKLPSGTKFPNGSVIFKDIRTNNGATTTYAVLYKDSTNPQAGNGWLWAEFSPNGSVGYSIRNRGNDCTSCHSREQGPQNDFVRTFERQR